MACLLFIGIINAFQPSIVRRKSIRASTVLESVSVNDEVVTRRSWAVNSISAASAIAAFSSRSRVAGASETLAPVKSSEALSVLCDPSVSTFRNPSNNRIIHILGTAHISSASADVAGQLVRSTKPDAVFVELDAKRVGRAIPKPAISDQPKEVDDVTGGTATSMATANVSSPSSSSENSPIIGPAPDQAIQQSAPTVSSRNPFNLKEKIMNKASQAVGNSIKGLYQKLESDGFSAGEEFVVAVREGLSIGSKIVLGDQDVEVSRFIYKRFLAIDFFKYVHII